MQVCLFWMALLVAVGIDGQPLGTFSMDELHIACPGMKLIECLNSQGGCAEGERLVVMKKEEYSVIKCVKNRSSDGTACTGLLSYKGRCHGSGSKSACEGSGLGKRLSADLYGTVACRCAVDLGTCQDNPSQIKVCSMAL